MSIFYERGRGGGREKQIEGFYSSPSYANTVHITFISAIKQFSHKILKYVKFKTKSRELFHLKLS
jgi:hypothetical protein